MYIEKAKIVVLKIGSSNIVDKRGNLREKWLKSLVNDIKKLVNKDKKIVIVSSGAIALGQSYLKIKSIFMVQAEPIKVFMQSSNLHILTIELKY